MKNNFKIYLSILIGLLIGVVFSCKKETDNVSNQKENPDFDPQFAIESKVSINTNEIGGTNLFLVSAQDQKSELSKGEFNTVVSKIGEQFLVVKDENDKVRALTLSTPNSNSTIIMNVNATSTATTLIFLSPGIITLDPNEAAITIQKIQNLSSYSEFKLFLNNNLKSKSLDEIVKDVKYDPLLSNCITEYANSKTTKSARPFSEGKNNFLFTFTGNSIELQNKGFRFVNIVRRDLGSANKELETSVVVKEMDGAKPLSWGSLFTNSTLNPTIENTNYIPTSNVLSSEFWIVGPGNIFKSFDVPTNIRNIEQPWSETIVYYLVFPMLDLWTGSKSLTNMASPMFKELMSSIKGAKSTIKLTQATDILAFNSALIDFCISAVGVIATSAAVSGISGIGAYVGVFLAISSGVIIAPANLGYFTANMFLIDPYCKFVVQQENETGSVTDVDGNVYKTVKIGDQWWMAENLKTTKYRNSESIPNVTIAAQWNKNLVTGAYCWYNNDISNKAVYGALYNWYAVNDNRNIAPLGWHIATTAEWRALTNFLDITDSSIREPGSAHWLCPNTSNTNYSGFSSVPGGGRDDNGSFNDIGYIGYWWCPSEDGIVTHYWYIYNDICGVVNYNYSVSSGLSIRCVKD